MLKRLFKGALRARGYELTPIRPAPAETRPAASEAEEAWWTDLTLLVERTEAIPGMVTDECRKILYTLCYQQTDPGDVAEIGTWQGKSATFLAQAVKDSDNGVLHAIDHFQGNPGKSALYKVDRDDLSDLEAGFRRNLEALGLSDSVRIHNRSAAEAAKDIPDRSLRFLFIDGEHTKEAVERDLRDLWPKLRPGAIVVFDDYIKKFPGVVDVVTRLARGLRPPRGFAFQNTFVVMLPKKGLPKQPPLA